MKKVISYLLCLIVTLSTAVNAAVDYYNDTAQYLYQTVSDPQVGSIGGEWTVIGLARSDADIPQEYFDNYYAAALNYIKSKDGVLHSVKYTEYSRVILALTAIGKNPENAGGYNLTTPLLDFDKTLQQGINGAIWALIALDSGNYGTDEIKKKYVAYLLKCENPKGGWALASDTPDADITAMALQALAKYREDTKVEAAVERALDCLSEMQNEKGGFSSWSTENSESCSQVIAALCELGIPLDDSRFVKNGNTLTDNLLSYYIPENGFCHIYGGGSNLMATEQAFYALVDVKRVSENKNSLYRMTDAVQRVHDENTVQTGLDGKNHDVKKSEITAAGKTFYDIKGHKYQKAVEALASRNIINGKSENSFEPDSYVSRAEFAAITVRALGLPEKDGTAFADVTAGDWYYKYVNTARSYGIVNGISESEFNPNGTITREEAVVMTARAAALCGMKNDMATAEARDILAEFADYVKISSWAVNDFAFCCREKIAVYDDMDIKPKENISRGEIADMVYNMLDKSNLLGD